MAWYYCRVGIPGEGSSYDTQREAQQAAQDEFSGQPDQMNLEDIFLVAPAGQLWVPDADGVVTGELVFRLAPEDYFEKELAYAGGWAREDLWPATR